MEDTFDVFEYLSVFLDEVDEQLQKLSEDILLLEKNCEDKDTIQRIFRAAHTLKGSSGAMGFAGMQELTHSMENVLDRIRRDDICVSSDIITLLFECLDALRLIKESIVNQNSGDIDTSALIGRLALAGTSQMSGEKASIRQADFILDLDSITRQVLKEGIMQGYRANEVYVKIIPDSQMKSIRAYLVANNLKEVAEIVTSCPGKDDLENERFEDSVIFVVLTNGNEDRIIDTVNRVSEIVEVRIREITLEDLEEPDYNSSPAPKFDFEIARGSKLEVFRESQVSADVRKSKISQVMRVDVNKIDSLMNMIGEMVINQTRIAQLSSSLKAKFRNCEDIEALLEVSQHTSRIVSTLQEGVMRVRMLPIEQLFNRFPRLVRDLSLSSGKKVNLVIEGQDTELDRTLIEEISDPLIHLLRNSVDHGIEDPACRLSSGKPEEGTVKICARHKDNMIEITVEDDGKGIDAALIKDLALNKGILKKDEADALTETDAINLIFRPGFSTSSTVSEVSGRGVGMDIVRAHIEKVNGIIDIETSVGTGTRFLIKIPLTLAIIPSLLVKIGDMTAAVSMSSVMEIVRIGKSEISSINKREAAVVRGKVLPLVRLYKRFGGIPEDRKNLFIVVIGSAEKRIGLIVDKLMGNQDVVLKTLGKYIGKIEGISGATILGDGDIALIPDVGYMIRKAVMDSGSN